jgi:hypothetical protein
MRHYVLFSGTMPVGPITLDDYHVCLQPVSLSHVPALWRVGAHEDIWRYLPYPMRSEADMRVYIEAEIVKQQAGLVVRFVTVAKATAQPIGQPVISASSASIVVWRSVGRGLPQPGSTPLSTRKQNTCNCAMPSRAWAASV